MKRIWLSLFLLAVCAVSATADLVTYDVVAEPGERGFNGMLTGSITWDTSVITNTEAIPQSALDYWNNTVGISLDGGVMYRELTLGAASSIDIRYTEGGVELARWDAAVFTSRGTDTALLAGQFGATDLYALGGHAVRLPGSPEFPFLGLFGSSIVGLSTWSVAIGDFTHFEQAGAQDFVNPAWFLQLRATEPVPEPGTLALVGAAVFWGVSRRRRRRAR